MNDYGAIYISRWGEPGHDGLTLGNLEGARRLGWLTQEQVDDLLSKTEKETT